MRVNMGNYNEQFERVKRLLKRIENQNRSQIDYEDDLWFFFQSAWHLKDWIENDASLNVARRDDIERICEPYPRIMICADLANRTKHSELTRKIRADAKHTRTDVTIKIGIGSEYRYTIANKDKAEYDALELAKGIVTDWEEIIKSHVR